MSRVKRGVTKHSHHARLLKQASGFYGRRKNTFRAASQAVDKSRQYAYIGRRLRKRDLRSLWIQRINAASRMCGMTYSVFMAGMSKANLELDRKVLSDLGANDFATFSKIAKLAQASLKQNPASGKA